MATTQSEDPNERVDHPRHYNQHPSGIECIQVIEHLPTNIGNAVKYLWRCGLKTTETPLRDLQSARWYTEREIWRIKQFGLEDEPWMTAKIVFKWRKITSQVVSKDDGELGEYLRALMGWRSDGMLEAIDRAIDNLKEPADAP